MLRISKVLNVNTNLNPYVIEYFFFKNKTKKNKDINFTARQHALQVTDENRKWKVFLHRLGICISKMLSILDCKFLDVRALQF